ncbi:MAG TPA: histidine kinase N-terminal domain-containing protein, partial [Chloroflexota bacterium]|nr:histidine kinase N-terminal domain-containing protein [Chloroflexota bacterium]
MVDATIQQSAARPGSALDKVFAQCPDLSAAEVEAIETMARSLPVVADLSRADALIYCRTHAEELVIVGEAKPYSVSSVHVESMVGKRSDRHSEPVVFKTFDKQRTSRGFRPGMIMGATTTQEVFPFLHNGRLVAAVSFETNETVRNRHRRRSPVILKSVALLQEMLLHNRLDLSGLSRTSERDALLVVDPAGHIQYLSGTAE